MAEEATKMFILECTGGRQRRVEVPASWKVTFGPIAPGSRYESDKGLCLRFYEGKDLQRAVFTDVRSFRDASIPVLEKVTKTQKKRHTKSTPEGMKDFVVEARVTEWRDPDSPDDVMPGEEFLSLPGEDAEAGGSIPF